MKERSLVLCGIVVLLTLLLSVRLFEIQITQSEVWAGEAARLVRSGTLLPYRRGSILDSDGRELIHDEAAYRLELSYREFRRNHVLGCLAHARSALEARAVSLPETLDAMEYWALEFSDLSPSELDEFARGGALQTESFTAPAVLNPEEILRARRASDIGFYIASLLGLDKIEKRNLKRLKEDQVRLPSYAELVASWRDQTVEEVQGELLDRIDRGRTHLTLLAERLDMFNETDDEMIADPLIQIVDHLEVVRSSVEELVAAGLFREAAGFSPGRIDPYILEQGIDLSWIVRSLYWDDDRIELWTEQTRARWISWRDGYAMPRLLVEFLTEGGGERTPERLMAFLGTIYSPPEVLEAILNHSDLSGFGTEPAVFGKLSSVFDVDPLPEARGFVLEYDPNAFGAGGEVALSGWPMFEPLVNSIDVTHDDGQPDKNMAYRVRRLRKSLKMPERLSQYDLELVARKLVPWWEDKFQDALFEQLFGAVDLHTADGRIAPNGRLAFSTERSQLALESLRDVLRDYGDRSIAIDPRPRYEAVYLLTRFPEEYHGFRAVDARIRVRSGSSAIAEGEGQGSWSDFAAEVLGSVSAVGVDRIQRQRRRENRMRELRSITRDEDQESELRQLIGEVFLHNESQGISGIEGEWDHALRGRNGYREARGLMDRFGRGRKSSDVSQREDGLDVKLTIDGELQLATERMLEDPVYDPDDLKVDKGWFAEPVGAIVMLSTEGEVVVSASVPNASTPIGEARLSQRADRSIRIDRTLRKPGFLPPGSVFKPFVALWALEHLGLDSSYEVECRRKNGQPAEYNYVRCWNSNGHGSMDLSAALKNSCNCYFAWLGASYPSVQTFQDMASALGFGQQTGLRRMIGSTGLFEEYVPSLFRRPMAEREASLAGNGLAVVEATPMQVARATLALATGKLFTLTNVDEVGGQAIPRYPPLDMDISEEVLVEVREALYRVANEPGGTAYKALNSEKLGVEICVKTGSADLTARVASGEVPSGGALKHTWVAGWLPPENPVAVFVVFLDGARATSSHTAVYVARQFLGLPETREWLEERGVIVRER